jgi:predicted nuclease of predicted toxin-antitoxin system
MVWNFRSKRALLAVGAPDVFQFSDVGLSRYSTDPEVFQEAQQRRLVLVTKDTDFIRQSHYAIGHDGILYVHQSKTEVSDLITAVLALASQYPTIANLRFEILPGAKTIQIP